jgi:hypothetical protein
MEIDFPDERTVAKTKAQMWLREDSESAALNLLIFEAFAASISPTAMRAANQKSIVSC